MIKMNFIISIIGIIIILSCTKQKDDTTDPPNDSMEVKAADVSFLPEIRKSGITTRNRNGQIEDMLTTLKKEGCNTIRLRLWYKPTTEHSGFNEVKTFAQEIKGLGMKVWLTVHYSDTWADPGKQGKPASWKSLGFTPLKDSVYQYTARIVREINPEYI
ncbi:MAG: glycosyl hydrolase 53 family protein, partial [Saprospiraceae bacterium]|nr:glycosyl hydrolase 53 family protein [Saprospiraceae bacterium]